MEADRLIGVLQKGKGRQAWLLGRGRQVFRRGRKVFKRGRLN